MTHSLAFISLKLIQSLSDIMSSGIVPVSRIRFLSNRIWIGLFTRPCPAIRAHVGTGGFARNAFDLLEKLRTLRHVL